MNLEKQGTYVTKDKRRRLDYQKRGSSFEVIEYEHNKEKLYVRKTPFIVFMSEKMLLNYINTENYDVCS